MKESTRSTRDASRHRRCGLTDQMCQLRDLLPATTTSRLSQLHILALSHAYIATNNFFNHFMQPATDDRSQAAINEFDFISCLPGFLLIAQLNGKLLYVSENVSNYIGYSMTDVLSQLDSVYEMISHQDHDTLNHIFQQSMVQRYSSSRRTSQCGKTTPVTSPVVNSENNENNENNVPAECCSSQVAFICRMHFGRIGRRSSSLNNIQSLEKDKTMLVRGYLVTSPSMTSQTEAEGCSNQTIFVAMCTPHLSVNNNNNYNYNNNNYNNNNYNYNIDSCLVFRSIHSLDMKFINIDPVGRCCLGYGYHDNVRGASWYQFIHPDDIQEAMKRHLTLVNKVNLVSRCALCVRVQSQCSSDYIWLHTIMSIDSSATHSNNSDVTDDFSDVTGYKSCVVCYNQVIDARDVEVTRQRDNIEESELQVSLNDNPLLPTVVANERVTADLGELSLPVTRAEVMYRLRKKMKHRDNNDHTLPTPSPSSLPSLPSVPSLPAVSVLPISSCSSVQDSFEELNVLSIPSPPFFTRADQLPAQPQDTFTSDIITGSQSQHLLIMPVTHQPLIPVMVDEVCIDQSPVHSRNIFGIDSAFQDSSHLPFYPQTSEDIQSSFLLSPNTFNVYSPHKSSFQSSSNCFTQCQTIHHQPSTVPQTFTNNTSTLYTSTKPTSTAVPRTFTNNIPQVSDLPELDFDALKTFFMNPGGELESTWCEESMVESPGCLPNLNRCQGLDVDYLEKLLVYGDKLIVSDVDSLAASEYMPHYC